MSQINKGDRIYSKTSNSYHIVDNVEFIGGYELVFTEDSKCFPINFVSKCVNSFYEFLEKKFCGDSIPEEEYDYFVQSIAEQLPQTPIESYDLKLFVDTGVWIKRSLVC
jgi:hypothetical protein